MKPTEWLQAALARARAARARRAATAAGAAPGGSAALAAAADGRAERADAATPPSVALRKGETLDPDTGEIRHDALPHDDADEDGDVVARGDAGAAPAGAAVDGERSIVSVTRVRSTRNRAVGTLGVVTAGAVMLAVLGLFVSNMLDAREAAAKAEERAKNARVDGESIVPGLEGADVAPAPAVGVVYARTDIAGAVLGGPPEEPAVRAPNATAGAAGIAPAPGGQVGAPATGNAYPAVTAPAGTSGQPNPQAGTQASTPPPAPPPDPKLAKGALMTGAGTGEGGSMMGGGPPATLSASPTAGGMESVAFGGPGAGGAGAGAGGAGGSDSLGGRLRPTPTPAVAAQVLPTRRFLLSKGTSIDCTLITAINSSLPGMVTCIVPVDHFGESGEVVLIPAGSKLVGETRGDVRQGQGRVFTLWTELTTPTGVRVALASPGTDELGRSGLPGFVNTHFWERFGAAIMVSVVDAATRGLIARQSGVAGGNSIVLNPQGSTQVMTEILRGTINIPNTVVKNQGDRIQILLARDADFRTVYALQPTAETLADGRGD